MAERAQLANGITERLQNWSDNQKTEDHNALMSLVYDELNRQAHRYLQKERVGHTLQTTALVNEAYLKLIQQQKIAWESRSYFFGKQSQVRNRNTDFCILDLRL